MSAAESAVPDLDVPRLGEALAGRYRIERELGAGGMAVVFLAEDLKHHRPVAVKVLRPELAALLGTERFLREIALAARLRHPNLLPLFDSGEALVPGEPQRRPYLFYVMPLVEGESLRDRMDRAGPMPVEEALALLREVAAGLSHAHSMDILHRDIKPDNILLDSGHAVLADFGIARAMRAAGGAQLTDTGMAVGTPAYMSPEQATGGELDARSDIYSLACVLYEMLAGEPPFTGPTAQAILVQRLSDPVRPLRSRRASVPAFVDQAILRALAREPAARPGTIGEFVDALVPPDAALDPVGRRQGRFRRWAVPALVVLAAATAAWRSTVVRQRTTQVDSLLPAILHAIENGAHPEAYALAEQAERLAPRHAFLRELWPRMSARVTIESEPAGADVRVRLYADTSAPWVAAGTTPIRSFRLALGVYRMRFTRAGYDSLELLAATPEVSQELFIPGDDSVTIRPDSVIRASLVATGEAPGMVRVPVDTLILSRGYSTDYMRLPASAFYIDRVEVTNEAYQRFVDAGGYQDSAHWDRPIVVDGAPVTWAAAMRRFHDRSGRPGPAGWEGGAFPPGAARQPVGGISWYEASAYARFAGKQLPTIWHWFTASGWPEWGRLAPISNLDGSGPAPGGRFAGVNRYGALDFAGNMKEWTANATEAGGTRRYLPGGSWLDPGYFAGADARPAWDRSHDNGIRLMRHTRGGTTPAASLAPSDVWSSQIGSYGAEIYETASASEFALYRDHLYGYAPSPLQDSVHRVEDDSRLWRRETVSFAAAYGGERIRAYLFIPKGAGLRPPYSTVVYLPSGMAWARHDSRKLGRAQGQHDYFWEFIAMSGRAVLYPIVKGTYERQVRAVGVNADQTLTVQDVQDVRRAVDYLMTRRDVDTTRLAFYGFSQGAYLGPIVAALEPRFRTSVLMLSTCLNAPPPAALPPATPMRFLPWVRMPVLFINGEHDYTFSDGRACFERQFQLLGTPPRDRKNTLYPGSHSMWGTFGHEARREILAWLDRYLGPGLDSSQ